ncbi:MAG: TonB-dependent receptor plug domain-containing protein, partial [Pseudomonadota bacterium]
MPGIVVQGQQDGAAAAGEGTAGEVEETGTSPVDGYVADVTATATKTDTPIREVPQSISVITADQIKDQGARTIQDTLRYTPGVAAEGFGLDSRTDSAFIRGTPANEYLD